jgi:apolipoprotein N-acyltransferase
MLGAGLTALALPRMSFWVFGWFGLVPCFFAANESQTSRQSGVIGLIAGFIFHAVVLHWIYLTCRFAQIPALVGAMAWLGLALVLALNWAVGCFIVRWLSDITPTFLRPWMWAVSWTAIAAFSQNWTSRLNVDLLTYTQGPNLALLQAGSWGGPNVVGFLVVLVNAAIAEAWPEAMSREKKYSSAVAPLSFSFALTAFIWVHGAWLLLNKPALTGSAVPVQILQPNIDQYRKWDVTSVDQILSGLDDLLTAPSANRAQLVVWPETSIPRWVARGEAVPEAAKWAKKNAASHLVGIIARPEFESGPTNGVQLVAGSGEVAGFYAKRQLVPFGEYVPLRSFVPRFVIDRWLGALDQLGDMTPGPHAPELLTTAFGPTAVTICYEAMFPRWARLDVSRGARLLVNVTNDGWYKDSWGPYQHFAANALRAIENRVTVIRSGNTGISAVIDPWGQVVAQLPLNTRGRLDVDVPTTDYFPNGSFYSRHGDWLGTLCLILLTLACVRNLIWGQAQN